jgi:DNA polymerase III delta subunit
MLHKGTPTGTQAGVLGVSPYFLREYQEAVRRHSSADIEHAFDLLAEADEQLKFTSIETKQVMHTLVVQLLDSTVSVL